MSHRKSDTSDDDWKAANAPPLREHATYRNSTGVRGKLQSRKGNLKSGRTPYLSPVYASTARY
jgi:hypothetical protein